MLEVVLCAPTGRTLIQLITPVVVAIGLVSCIDDIILEVTESIGATVKVVSCLAACRTVPILTQSWLKLGYFIVFLITPVVVDISLVSCIDDTILEVMESIRATVKVVSHFHRTMARHKNQDTCK